MPEIGRTSDQRSAQIKSFSDLFTKTLLDKAMPELKGQYTSRGLEGSTAEARGYNDLLTQAITQGIFSGQDLFNQDETMKRSNLGALEGGLQEAFNRLLGITQEGRAQNQQKFAVETANADRQFQAQAGNLSADVSRRNADTNAQANLAGLGTLLAFQNGGLFGGSGGGTGVINNQAMTGTLSKTGGATSGGGGRGWGEAAKSPDTWLQLAQLAAMFASACFVSAEIFGGWHAPQTVRARNYILFSSNGKFRDFYIRHGKQIAEVIRGNKIMKEILRPIFEEMAEKGKYWMEAYRGKN